MRGYLSEVLLNTVPGVQKEYQEVRAAEARQALRKSIAKSRARRYRKTRKSGAVERNALDGAEPSARAE